MWQTVTVTFNTVRCPCNGLVREVSPKTPHWHYITLHSLRQHQQPLYDSFCATMTSSTSAYRPLLAFKTKETTDILKHDAFFDVCLFLVVKCALFMQQGLGLGLVLGLAVAAISFTDAIDFLCFERRSRPIGWCISYRHPINVLHGCRWLSVVSVHVLTCRWWYLPLLSTCSSWEWCWHRAPRRSQS